MLLMQKNQSPKNFITERKLKYQLDGGNCRTENIVYAARCKIHGGIYIDNTGEELVERFNKHKYDTKNKPDNHEFAAYIHKSQHNFDKDIEVFILKGNLIKNNYGKRTMARQIHLFIGNKRTTET